MKRILFSLLVMLAVLAIATGHAKEPVYISNTSQKNELTNLKFWNYLKQLSSRDIAKAGFLNNTETTRAILGHPFSLYLIDDMKNLTYRGNNIYDIITKSSFWFYPIVVERKGIDTMVSLLKVTGYRGNFEIQSICCAKTAQDLDKIVSIWSQSQGFKLDIFKIQTGTNIDLVIVENKNVSGNNINPALVALPEVYDRYKTIKPMYAYEFAQIHSWLKARSREKIKEQGLNPYDIEGTPPPAKKTSMTKAKTKITPMKKLSQGKSMRITKTKGKKPVYQPDVPVYDQSVLEQIAEEDLP